MSNALSFKKTDSFSPWIGQCVDVYETSFPVEERRPTSLWLNMLDGVGSLECISLFDGDTFAGFITIWQLDGFYYLEHFAMVQKMRGHGFGKTLLSHIVSKCGQTPIVLEVEKAEGSDLAARRIGFYNRNGFGLSQKTYLQPPYEKGGNYLPLNLMSTNMEFLETHFDDIRSKIHTKVYGIE